MYAPPPKYTKPAKICIASPATWRTALIIRTRKKKAPPPRWPPRSPPRNSSNFPIRYQRRRSLRPRNRLGSGPRCFVRGEFANLIPARGRVEGWGGEFYGADKKPDRPESSGWLPGEGRREKVRRLLRDVRSSFSPDGRAGLRGGESLMGYLEAEGVGSLRRPSGGMWTNAI